VTKSGIAVSPTFITLTTTTNTGDTLNVAPTVSADQGTWVVTIVACLSPYFTGAACVSKTINVVVDPCKVTST
jgi:hypothetical protein